MEQKTLKLSKRTTLNKVDNLLRLLYEHSEKGVPLSEIAEKCDLQANRDRTSIMDMLKGKEYVFYEIPNYYITFKGRHFIENGGFVAQERRDRFQYRNQVLQAWFTGAVAIGALIEIIYYIWQMS